MSMDQHQPTTPLADVTGINYVSDADFIDSGEPRNILPLYNSLAAYKQLTSLTSFPENVRNCYTLRPTQGKDNKYMIRASFMHGNYDFSDQLPEFDVYLGPNYWNTINFNSSVIPVIKEIIHLSSSDYIHVCLVNTGRGTPFISTIELRLLEAGMYNETSYASLSLDSRINYGISSGTVRYRADKYDRLWSPYIPDNCTSLYTSKNSMLPSPTGPPSEVMSTAITPKDPNGSLIINWNPHNITDKFSMYIYLAEIELLTRNQTRKFSIYMNGKLLFKDIFPLYHITMTVSFNELGLLALVPPFTFTINKTENSTLPPSINALELYTFKRLPQRQTDDREAFAMWSIKSTYRITRHWQGDPCAPREFVWDGIRCSYNDVKSPRIISLNLSVSGLNGEIYPGLANLTMIETLDLSNNNLTGTVPNFLSGMNFLKVLNLKGNNFSGPIPEGLLAKSRKGLLSLSLDDEGAITYSCDKNRCKDKDDKIIFPVMAVVVFVFMILTALTAIWIIKKQKARGTGLEIRKQQFTYSEVRTITNEFAVVIGKGGFGTVYRGNIDDTQVAVKMLSESSLQGDKEFQAEAYLLLSVHHKNLTLFVGYCNEGNHKGIIYEYMANGNLERHLFDAASSNVLNWEERLQIGCDAAHGLEYLHHGCKPPVVHRDVKCTNILLNETFQAKLADFGLSRAFPIEGGTHISTAVAGTPGYLDPEYYTSNRLTEKSDVYSFGVVLLVLITGQPAITKYENDNIHIGQLVNLKLASGDMNNIVDQRLLGEFEINSAWKAVELAMACVAHTPSRRPTMNEVVMELNDCLVTERARPETRPNNLTGLVSLNLESAYDLNPI